MPDAAAEPAEANGGASAQRVEQLEALLRGGERLRVMKKATSLSSVVPVWQPRLLWLSAEEETLCYSHLVVRSGSHAAEEEEGRPNSSSRPARRVELSSVRSVRQLKKSATLVLECVERRYTLRMASAALCAEMVAILSEFVQRKASARLGGACALTSGASLLPSPADVSSADVAAAPAAASSLDGVAGHHITSVAGGGRRLEKKSAPFWETQAQRKKTAAAADEILAAACEASATAEPSAGEREALAAAACEASATAEPSAGEREVSMADEFCASPFEASATAEPVVSERRRPDGGERCSSPCESTAATDLISPPSTARVATPPSTPVTAPPTAPIATPLSAAITTPPATPFSARLANHASAPFATPLSTASSTPVLGSHGEGRMTANSSAKATPVSRSRSNLSVWPPIPPAESITRYSSEDRQLADGAATRESGSRRTGSFQSDTSETPRVSVRMMAAALDSNSKGGSNDGLVWQSPNKHSPGVPSCGVPPLPRRTPSACRAGLFAPAALSVPSTPSASLQAESSCFCSSSPAAQPSGFGGESGRAASGWNRIEQVPSPRQVVAFPRGESMTEEFSPSCNTTTMEEIRALRAARVVSSASFIDV
ncbi:hypothetical protein AB1Y20_016136 [Prymnesium parvum]|uniref:Uncharacterized protein n=1 Tax=Prymnesium parvum TaxID=97485 RepID=A0AB34K307_PRYPA